MKIYISGISGTGMGPLALMAKNAGFDVCGSDLAKGAVFDELMKAGVEVSVGRQDGKFLQEKLKDGVDWFVYTSALPNDHPELKMVRKAGIKCTKRDDLTAFLVDELGLKMIAVAGTHGKTTTTSMIVWAALKLKMPVAYIVGTNLGFAPSGRYKKGDKYFVYEADEYDRNFLKYHPWLAIVTCVSYDHPDIYPTKKSYVEAFEQFKSQSKKVIDEDKNADKFKLAGAVRREDAGFAMEAIKKIAPRIGEIELIHVLNRFPGTGRRFEKIGDGVYTDYAHHPEEIAATLNVALEEAKLRHKKGVVVVYQPHQNVRQHKVRKGYKNAFVGAEKIFWLPTYLVREDKRLKILTPEDLIGELSNKEVAEVAKLGCRLKRKLKKYLKDGYLVILMTAGPADEWFREKFGD